MPKKPVSPEFDPETNEPLLNWTKTSNRMIEMFTEKKITGDVQFATLLLMAKETWGHLPKRPWMRLVVSKEAERLNCSRQALINALKDAESRNLIESKKDETGKNRGQLYRLTNWKDVLDPKKADKKPKADITADPARNSVVLLPGRSGTITVELMVNSQVARIDVECHNTLSQRATFQGAAGADGKILLTIVDEARSGGKSKAETGRIKGSQSVKSTLNSFVDNKEVNSNSATKSPKSSANGNSAVSAPVLPPVPPPSHSRPTPVPHAENPARREFEAFVTELRQEVWNISTDPAFLRRIMERAEDTPVEAFERRLIVRFGRDYRGALNRQQSVLLPGLLLDIANDALRDHRAAEAQRKATAAKEAEQRTHREQEHQRFFDSLSAAERAEHEALLNGSNLPGSDLPEKDPTKTQCGKCLGTGKGKEAWFSVGGTYGPHPTKCDECHGSGKTPAARGAAA